MYIIFALTKVKTKVEYIEAIGLWNFLPIQEETSDSYVYNKITPFLLNSEIKTILKGELAFCVYRLLTENV